MQTYAKIICDSSYENGPRLTSFEVRFHRFVLAEANTHRAFGRGTPDDLIVMEEFSRNSASSRAIPLAKQLEKVRTHPAMPVVWASEQKGMQGGDEIDKPHEAEDEWVLRAAVEAADSAERLGAMGVHKSIANRLLEPFLMHTVVITATAFENFFNLRLDTMAQPEIRVAAEAMKAAYDQSLPATLKEGDWHLPYVTREEIETMEYSDLVKISSARCARVSYETQAGVRDHAADFDLYERLTSNGHASPLEHVATPAPDNQHEVTVRARIWSDGVITPSKSLLLPKYGNLLGWHSHRFDAEIARDYQAFA